MGSEPESTRWTFPTLEQMDPDDDLVALGADLEPGTLLAAYRAGLFPMPSGPVQPWVPRLSRFRRGPRRDEPLAWFSPVRRGVLPLDGLRVSRSLRRACRDFDVRLDTAFDDVVAGCSDPSRDGAWIDDRIALAYGHLHRLGWAHSVEAWRDGELVGGLYGVAIGGLFAGESMFHRERDASKVALVGLVEALRDEHADARLLDVQWRTDHLASLGVVEIPRAEYLTRLSQATGLPLPGPFVA
ncbi:leucyl/phenylalanyl-tRNA--protein transferase [Nocardioides sp. TRM66260-LWL]|uniref:leucyl/phenylalanyl-tRNA--protein transferase n=1 Tax=Nocardioides sp. TRM66260-LWL TaxID=2874478 RepID=UPI001CC58F3D|nr:leucyl/phenylalanyl-tRNA--protein transferase [Nocardioides sp. TRM66260-LWL]MBZ5735626.1 leucyl/phenylalanyl-tRNA--protein transferase [Nocardioides sp. TRM66260-LWL]